MGYNNRKRACLGQRRKVFVMMSGGVDSSVAAFLLAKNKEYDVVGCFIKGYNIDGCQEKDAEDARRVAEKIDIPFYVFDLGKEYKKHVMNYMINGYKKGITPNPDVMCNKEIKFGLFLKKALRLGADYVATGHYIRLVTSNQKSAIGRNKKNDLITNCQLLVARDKNKDQSYFLWTLTQEQLRHCLFPIGDYLKSEVRKIAQKAGLLTADKKDSQGICFLGMLKLNDFLKKFLPIKKGDIIFVSGNAEEMVDGKKIGEHDGVWFYTIGQRHFKITNRKGQIANSKPLYIVDKNIKKNILVVAEKENSPALFKKEIELLGVNINQSKIKNPAPIFARIRYRQPLTKAMFCKKAGEYKLVFAKPIKFAAPGQSAVFYSLKGELLGGGIIK